MSGPSETEKMLLQQLRESDRDRYLAALLAPADKRAGLAALYAYNAEIARVRERVSEALPGEIRLQYWRDLIEGQESGETDGNPLAKALLETIRKYNLPRQAFIDMSEARIFDLYDDPMASVNDFEGYAGETASALIQLSSLVLDPEKASVCADLAGHAGVAQTVAGLILLLPVHSARGQIYLPEDILRATGLTRESFLGAGDQARKGEAIRAFAALGMGHLKDLRALGRPDAAIMPAFLPLAGTGEVLAKAQRLGEAALTQSIQPSQWRRQAGMVRSLLFRKI